MRSGRLATTVTTALVAFVVVRAVWGLRCLYRGQHRSHSMIMW